MARKKGSKNKKTLLKGKKYVVKYSINDREHKAIFDNKYDSKLFIYIMEEKFDVNILSFAEV